jgi:hypothetical protein
MFTTNVPGIGGEFLPENLTVEEANSLEYCLEHESLVDYLNGIYKLHVSLPPEFWIAG